jgi:DNA-binding transcriptional MerR regulator
MTVAAVTLATMAAPARHDLTIDELARETGMTVRNIRAHQSRGLLQPPEVRARTGYYGPEHVVRLRLIKEMQAEGFNLKAIQRLVDASNGAGEQVLDLGRALLGSFVEEEPEFWTAEELQQRLGGPFDRKTIEKARKLDLVRPLGDDRFEVPSPTMLRAGEELASVGIPLRHMLAVAERMERSSRSIAESFVRLFMEDVVGSDPAAHSAEDWARIRAALERLRPLATEAVRANFQQKMSSAVERQLAKLLGG